MQNTKETKNLLQGNWWGTEYDEHAVFYIQGDTINYVEHFDRFKYLIRKDTFDLDTKQPHYKSLILRLTKDSLILKYLPGGEISKYWRQD